MEAETLAVWGALDFMLIDGWSTTEGRSVAYQMTRLIVPQLRVGGVALNDNGEDDYLAFIHGPANGFLSMSLPLKGSTELSVKVR